MFCVGWAYRVEGSVCLWLAMIAFVWILTAFRTARMMNACPCASDISGSWLQRLESSERQGTQGLTRINLFKRRRIGAFPPITKLEKENKTHKSSDLPTCCTPQTTQSLGLRMLRIFANQKKNKHLNKSQSLPLRFHDTETVKPQGLNQAGANCYPGRKPLHKSLGDFRWKIIETQILGAETLGYVGYVFWSFPWRRGVFRDGFYPLVN